MNKLIGLCIGMGIALAACGSIGSSVPTPPVVGTLSDPKVQACLQSFAITCTMTSMGDQTKMAACMAPAVQACGVVSPMPVGPSPVPAK